MIHNDVLELGDWKKYVYWSPHFHIVGYFPSIKIKSDLFYRSTGWTYKNIGVTNSIVATVSYLLTHHAYISGGRGYTYFGKFSYTSAKIIKAWTELEPVTCPNCQAVLQRWTGVDIGRNCHGYRTYDYSQAKCLGDTYALVEINIYQLTKWTIKSLDTYFGEPEVSKNV